VQRIHSPQFQDFRFWLWIRHSGKKFQQAFQADLLGVDIIDNRVENIPLRLYNGEDLSFLSSNLFDVVLVNYVLHHTKIR